MMPKTKNRAGFTLVEAICATVILCGTVLAVGAASTSFIYEARLNRQYETAMLLADKQLSLIDYVGVDGFIEKGQAEGMFENVEPTYRWKVSTEYQEIDNLYLVRVTVSWIERNRPYSVMVDTMLN